MHTRTEYVNTYHIMYLCTFFPVFCSLSPRRFCFHSFYLMAHGRIEIPNQFCATRNIPTMSFAGLNLRPLAIKSCGNSKNLAIASVSTTLRRSKVHKVPDIEQAALKQNLLIFFKIGVKQTWKKSEKGRRFRHQKYTPCRCRRSDLCF